MTEALPPNSIEKHCFPIVMNDLPKLSDEAADSAVVLTLAGDLENAITYPDITFKFKDGKRIPAHRFILEKDSSYFRDFFTDNSECKEVDTTVGLSNFPDYETFIVYLHRLYSIRKFVNPFDPNQIGDIWYSYIDLTEYFHSELPYPKSYFQPVVALMNYSTSKSKFMYENYEIYAKFFHDNTIDDYSKLSTESFWILFNTIYCKNYARGMKTGYKTSDSQRPILLYLLSKYDFKFNNEWIDKVKQIDIDALIKRCPYILFDSYLPDFFNKWKKN